LRGWLTCSVFQRVAAHAHPGGQITPYLVIIEPTAGALVISTETNMKTPARPPKKCPEQRRQVPRGNVGAIGKHRFPAPDNCSQEKCDLKHILVPTDFSKSSKKALRYAVSLAGMTGSQITLLHVIRIWPLESEGLSMLLGSDPFANAYSILRKICRAEHVDPPLLRNALVREGIPYQGITDVARELEADLIILATNGHTRLSHVLLGGTTERVVRHAPCPVLVVREKGARKHSLRRAFEIH